MYTVQRKSYSVTQEASSASPPRSRSSGRSARLGIEEIVMAEYPPPPPGYEPDYCALGWIVIILLPFFLMFVAF